MQIKLNKLFIHPQTKGRGIIPISDDSHIQNQANPSEVRRVTAACVMTQWGQCYMRKTENDHYTAIMCYILSNEKRCKLVQKILQNAGN